MPELLLQTKLYIPPLRSNLVSRPRLIEQLNQGLEHNYKLTLLCAPAGFGKTTLIAEWIQKSKETGGRIGDKKLAPSLPAMHPSSVAWLSLDKNDNDPVRFLTYFTAALDRVNPGLGQEIGAMLSSSQSVVLEPLISAIINDIVAADESRPLVLILEDYHFIESPVIHDGLDFLLDHLPHRMHLVITSRADPPLSLSRLRARNQMLEIRARDLRFESGEVAAFLSKTMRLDLTAEMVATFERRTEGWIAGLQLAAISLQQQDDPLSFVTAFAGDDRYIADFLMEEVFQQQSSSVQAFLLGTSILDSLSAPLCDAVMEVDDSRATLNELEASNLFIVPLDNQRRWYRYHHLFADLLRQRLEESTSGQHTAVLHRRASQWYEENDSLITAVEHALAARDYQRAMRLIEQGEREIFQGSRLNTLLSWWSEIPLEIAESRPKLCLIYSWAWIATGHSDEAEGCLQAIERELGARMDALFSEGEKVEALEPAVHVVLVEIAVVRGQLAIVRGDIEESLKLSRLVLPFLGEIDQPYLHSSLTDLRTIVSFNMGMAYKLQGELGKAEPALSEAMSLGQERRNVHLVAVAFGHLANVQAIRGHLRQAFRTCHQGLSLVQEMAGRRSPMSGWLQVELANLLYEYNDLEAAYHHLQEGISVARPWSHLAALLAGHIGLARLRATQGDWSGAFDALDELAELGQINPEAVVPTVESFRARLCAAQGNVKAAGLWAETTGLHVDGELSYPREEESIVLARVLMAQEKWDSALRLIGRLLSATESGGRWGRVIELLILQALAFHAQDRLNEALDSLARALTLAEPQGYARIFVDEGESMAQLLYRAAAHGITPGYTGELLAAFQDVNSIPGAESIAREPKSGIVEPLSARELEVLDCLTEGLSNREIAQRLTISLTTVKTHNRSIYRKLDVNNRTQAVARGKALGII
ncbi:MAG: helix-turn-helix transcriptional regulator [Chloroflexota bacterium]|nr:MAG: helix-turn-helix transcriptional regulator [Chloroflexota bacterium]